MTESDQQPEPGPHPQAESPAGEDLIESDVPSARTTEIRRRLELLVPATVGRKFLGGIAVAALATGLVAGFLVGNVFGTERADPPQTQTGPPPDGGYIPIVPYNRLEEMDQGIIVFSADAGFLTLQDLTGLGEAALPGGYGLADISGLDGLCAIASSPERVPLPRGPSPEHSVFASASFRLAGATLTEQIGPDLNVLAASTLRGTVELAQNCPSSDDLTVSTEGIQSGIGDEYAVFTVRRPDPASGEIETSIVVLVRVGGQLIELSLTPEGGNEVPDGLTRAMAIAKAAVARMLGG